MGGAPLSVVCAASKQTTSYLTGLLFKEGFRTRELGSVRLRTLSSSRWLEEVGCAIALIQTDPFVRRFFEQDDWLFIPLWISGTATLPIADEMMKGKSIRSDVRVIRKAGLRARVTRDPERFDDFYYNMYVPHVTRAHGPSVYVNPYDTMKARLADSDLVMIHDGERDIAGMMIVYDEERPRLWSMGIRDGDRRYLKVGALTALYHFSCHYLVEKKFSSVSLGLSRAFLNDGVLRYKRKWAQRLADTASDRIAMKIVERTPAAMSFLQNNPFIFERSGQLYGGVFPPENDPLTPDDVLRLRERYFHDGLSSLILFTSHSDDTRHDPELPADVTLRSIGPGTSVP